MKDIGIVKGSEAQAKPIVVGFDTVYVHTDIQEIEVEEFGDKYTIYQYHEIQYEKDEYIQMMANNMSSIEEQLLVSDETAVELYETLIAQEEINIAQDETLVEIYEMMEGGETV